VSDHGGGDGHPVQRLFFLDALRAGLRFSLRTGFFTAFVASPAAFAAH
jgi:hypothetical protein